MKGRIIDVLLAVLTVFFAQSGLAYISSAARSSGRCNVLRHSVSPLSAHAFRQHRTRIGRHRKLGEQQAQHAEVGGKGAKDAAFEDHGDWSGVVGKSLL